MGRAGAANGYMPDQRGLSWLAKPQGQPGQPGPGRFVRDRIGPAVRDHHLRNRRAGYGSHERPVKGLGDQAKVAEPTSEPPGVTSLAPRSRPKSTRSVLENCPTPSRTSKVPAATVAPLSSRSMQTTRPS